MISVCIATYNGSKFIEEQLISILSQLKPEDEVLVSDDNSSDDTVKLIKSFNDSRISLYINHFGNPVLNFEYLIEIAKGEYIFLSDQDDIWAPNKVGTFLKIFSDNPEVGLVLSDIQVINPEGEKVNKVFFQNGFKSGFLQNIIFNNFIGCSMAFKNDIKDLILPFPKSIAMHDWWIGTTSILFSKVHFIDEKLHYYRRHDNNFTKIGANDIWTRIAWRWNLLMSLTLRYIKLKLGK